MQLDHIMYVGVPDVVVVCGSSSTCCSLDFVVYMRAPNAVVSPGNWTISTRIVCIAFPFLGAQRFHFFDAPAKKCPRVSGLVFVMKLIVSFTKRGHKWVLFLSPVFVPDSFFFGPGVVWISFRFRNGYGDRVKHIFIILDFIGPYGAFLELVSIFRIL